MDVIGGGDARGGAWERVGRERDASGAVVGFELGAPVFDAETGFFLMADKRTGWLSGAIYGT